MNGRETAATNATSATGYERIPTLPSTGRKAIRPYCLRKSSNATCANMEKGFRALHPGKLSAAASAALAATTTAASAATGFSDVVCGRNTTEFEGHADILAERLLKRLKLALRVHE